MSLLSGRLWEAPGIGEVDIFLIAVCHLSLIISSPGLASVTCACFATMLTCYLLSSFFIFVPNVHKPLFSSVPKAAPPQSCCLSQDLNKNWGIIRGPKHRWRCQLDGWLHYPSRAWPILTLGDPLGAFLFSRKCLWLLSSAISHLPTSSHFLTSRNVGVLIF